MSAQQIVALIIIFVVALVVVVTPTDKELAEIPLRSQRQRLNQKQKDPKVRDTTRAPTPGLALLLIYHGKNLKKKKCFIKR